MPNERKTEELVRNMLRNNSYYSDESILIEEQQSDNPKINKLLKNASKSGNGKGYPEFIISFSNKPNEIIIIECKADISKHESKNRKQYKEYAIDGVLLYADYLKGEFDVTAIAVSGENEREKKISTFLWLKNGISYIPIQDKVLLKASDISNIIIEQKKPLTEEEVTKKAISYNEFLHRYSIPEIERCTLISSILISLQDNAFLNGYREYENTQNKELIKHIFQACENTLKKHELDDNKIKIIIDEYKKFKNSSLFNSTTIKCQKNKKQFPNTILRDLIIRIHDEILPYVKNNDFDTLGVFYRIFIRYAGSDSKTGLVLTPNHITDLFCNIANLTENSIVFDPCCGTGGFLISAMDYMIKKAGNNSETHKRIKTKQLLGIELRTDMFTHTCSNMMMRGDGKSHIYHGDCFDDNLKKEIKQFNPDISFLNPPYQDGNSDEQLEFIENALDFLIRGGTCVAICQMSTVVGSNKSLNAVKQRLLEKHNLKAVFSMPNDLFHPIGVVTVILVFQAHIPHQTNQETFFGYFKDDGFEKRKNQGRVDIYNKWESIKDKWLDAYTNKKNITDLSVTQKVTAKDEWCAEAYMETDYSKLTEADFIKSIKEYVAFQFLYGNDDEAC